METNSKKIEIISHNYSNEKIGRYIIFFALIYLPVSDKHYEKILGCFLLSTFLKLSGVKTNYKNRCFYVNCEQLKYLILRHTCAIPNNYKYLV